MPWGVFTEILQEASPIDLRKATDITGPQIKFKNVELGNILQTLGLLSGPVPSLIAGLMNNRDSFTRRPIWNERDTGAEQLQSQMLYLWNLSVPTMLAGLPDIMLNTDQQRLQGSVRKLYGAMNDELNNRGLPKDTIGQSLARFGGVNIYGFEPKQARKDSIYFKRRSLKDVQRDMRIELRNMQKRGMPLKEISKRRKELMARIVEEQRELREYMQATRKAVNL